MTGTIRTFTFRELHESVATFAGALAALGVTKGDRVIIYMPMIPEAVVAMLAVARLGAIHSVVFGGFAARELAARIDDAKPTVVIAGSCGIEPGRIVAYKPLLDAAIDLARQTESLHCQRPMGPASMASGRDLTERAVAERSSPCVLGQRPIRSHRGYTSGTTGEPKGIVRDNGGHLVALNGA